MSISMSELLRSYEMTVVFWDVQHGNAVYIRTPNDRHIVIDLGRGSYGENNEEFSPLRYLQEKYKVNKIDMVIITHPHRDHIDDILNLRDLLTKSTVFIYPPEMTLSIIDEYMKKNFMSDQDKKKFEEYKRLINLDTNPQVFHDIMNYVKSKKIKAYLLKDELFGGVTFDFFFPRESDPFNFNNHSVVIVLSFAERKIVITGDNEEGSFKELMSKEADIDYSILKFLGLSARLFKKAIADADILLAPHHGRESGFHNDFINLVNPKLVVISDGRFCDTSATNRYSSKSRGIRVKRRNGRIEERKCVTTRNDGVIVVEVTSIVKEGSRGGISIRIGK